MEAQRHKNEEAIAQAKFAQQKEMNELDQRQALELQGIKSEDLFFNNAIRDTLSLADQMEKSGNYDTPGGRESIYKHRKYAHAMQKTLADRNMSLEDRRKAFNNYFSELQGSIPEPTPPKTGQQRYDAGEFSYIDKAGNERFLDSKGNSKALTDQKAQMQNAVDLKQMEIDAASAKEKRTEARTALKDMEKEVKAENEYYMNQFNNDHSIWESQRKIAQKRYDDAEANRRQVFENRNAALAKIGNEKDESGNVSPDVQEQKNTINNQFATIIDNAEEELVQSKTKLDYHKSNEPQRPVYQSAAELAARRIREKYEKQRVDDEQAAIRQEADYVADYLAKAPREQQIAVASPPAQAAPAKPEIPPLPGQSDEDQKRIMAKEEELNRLRAANAANAKKQQP
jgi:hypothetical protein